MADKAKPQGMLARRKATEDTDTEGHSISRSRDGIAARRKVVEGDGMVARRKVTEDTDTDTEGHSMLLNPMIAQELAKARERDVQKDLKDHRFEREARAAKKERR